MTDEDQLKEMYDRLRRSSPKEASPRCEQALVRSLRAARSRRHPRSAWMYWAAVAACLALLFAALLVRRPPRLTAPHEEPNLSGFIPLPYGQGDVPLEQITIVRVDLQSTSDHHQADLLIGQDGVPRAVRFVQ